MMCGRWLAVLEPRPLIFYFISALDFIFLLPYTRICLINPLTGLSTSSSSSIPHEIASRHDKGSLARQREMKEKKGKKRKRKQQISGRRNWITCNNSKQWVNKKLQLPFVFRVPSSVPSSLGLLISPASSTRHAFFLFFVYVVPRISQQSNTKRRIYDRRDFWFFIELICKFWLNIGLL